MRRTAERLEPYRSSQDASLGVDGVPKELAKPGLLLCDRLCERLDPLAYDAL